MDEKNSMKRAYRTTWKGFTSIVAAESVAQARSRTKACANEVDWYPAWIDIRVRRAPEYDGWAAVDETGHCWAEDQLENCRDK
jgi:hypothetical protein